MIRFNVKNKPVEMSVEKAKKIGAADAVLYTPQELTPEQQAQARENIGVNDEQIKGFVTEYLDENPVQAGATAEEAAQIAQNKADIEKLNADKLDASALPNAINDALAQAKESGEFDGEPGYTPVKGKDYYTEADKAEMVSAVIAALPVYNGEVVEE